MVDNVFCIREIIIDKLFGKYNYKLSKEDLINDLSRIIILYGDNGSGKTTILKLIFHILSPLDDRGHKSYVAQTPFEKITIKFVDGKSITVEKKEKILIGSFIMIIENLDGKKHSYTFVSDENNSITDEENPDVQKFLDLLSHLSTAYFLLTDDRDFESDFFETLDESKEFIYYIEGKTFDEKYGRSRLEPSDLRNLNIKRCIDRVEKWIKFKVARASSEGEINISNIYSEIIMSMSDPTLKSEIDSNKLFQLQNDLKSLTNTSKNFSEYKLTSVLDFNLIIKTITESPVETQRSIYTVLKPYVDGLMIKFESLTKVYRILDIFIKTFNELYKDKFVQFDLIKGFRIISNGGIIDSEFLSSGEKQLIIIFFNTLLARDKPSILLIDEPELSLNLKWQRKLINILLEITKGAQVQFIFATHSIELLAQFSGEVIKLE